MTDFIIIMQSQKSETKILSYRNAYYQGQFLEGLRHGLGVLITDSGQILVSNWKEDLPNGKAFAFINQYEYAYLQFIEGELNSNCYYCSEKEMLVIQFEYGRPINRQLLVNFYQSKVSILTYFNGTYQLSEQLKLEERQEEKIVQKYLGINMKVPSLSQFLQTNFCKLKNTFEMKNSPSGSTLFRYVDQSCPLSLGFSINKKQQLLSYGNYIDGKLQGFGCKIDSTAKYEGLFDKNLLHGFGMITSNGRPTLGQFNQGNLTELLKSQDKFLSSEDFFKQLSKKEHIRSLYFENNFIMKNIMKFNGLSEIILNLAKSNQSFIQKSQHSIFQQKTQNNPKSSHLRGSNITLNQIISSKGDVRQPEDLRPIVLKQYVKNEHWDERERSQGERREMGSSGLWGDPIRRFPFE